MLYAMNETITHTISIQRQNEIINYFKNKYLAILIVSGISGHVP